MSNQSFQDRLDGILGKGPEKWLSRSLGKPLSEDEEKIARGMEGLIRAKRQGKSVSGDIKRDLEGQGFRYYGNTRPVAMPPNWQGRNVAEPALRQAGYDVGSTQRPAPNSIARGPDGQVTKPSPELEARLHQALQAEAEQDLRVQPARVNAGGAVHPTNRMPSAERPPEPNPDEERMDAAPKKRKNSSNNFVEAAISAMLLNPRISNREDLITTIGDIPNMPQDKKERFLANLSTASDDSVQSTLQNLQRTMPEHEFDADPRLIFNEYSGRNNDLPEPLRSKLLNLRDSGGRNKADIIFKDRNKGWKGISAKAEKEAYQDTTGVEDAFLRVGESLGRGSELQDKLRSIRKQVLDLHGLPFDRNSYVERYGTGSGTPDDFKDIFRNPDNAYMNIIHSMLQDENIGGEFMSHWLDRMYPDDNLPYEMFRFDNDTFERIHRDNLGGKPMKIDRIGPITQRATSNAMGDMYGIGPANQEDEPFQPMHKSELRFHGPAHNGMRLITRPWMENKNVLRPWKANPQEVDMPTDKRFFQGMVR